MTSQKRPYSIIKRIGDSTTYFLKNFNIHNKSVFNNEVMPRKLTKDKYCKEKFKLRDGKNHNKHFIKKNINSEFTSLIDIGETNVKKWKLYKNKCLIKNDSDFVHYLLKLLEDKIGINDLVSDKNSDNSPSPPANPVDEKITNNVTNDIIIKKQITTNPKPNKNNQNRNKNDLLFTQSTHKNGQNDNITTEESHEIKDESKIKETPTIKKEKVINETIKSEYKVLTENGILESNTIIVNDQKHFNNDLKICDNFKSSFHKINYLLDEQNVENNCANLNLKSEIEFNIIETDVEHNNVSNSNENDLLLSNHVKKQKRKKLRRKDDTEAELKRRNKKKCHDIRKAPPLKLEPIINIIPEPTPTVEIENQNSATDTEENGELDNVTIKIKLCLNCDSRHLQDICPLLGNLKKIPDTITLNEWTSNSEKIDNEDINYASASLPSVCYLKEVNEIHGLGVFANTKIDKYVEMGPLVGPPIKEVNIPDDFNMKHIWEINFEEKPFYINTEDPSNSNWVRYIRPAETREKRNISAITRNKTVYLVTIHDINIDDELRYWIDDCTNATSNGKRRLEKTNCGGCNLTFDHALYYRTHCSIFHDARYSLTIRKYHCKVCGQAILGKDNIVKHAAELHNGQGAYQCQFCKKFFLRLNYLEMHRTYGCAANPHRSRPLCDFCGRKFCQPQKLKVHIKRMHSDISLSEFQCPLCLKLLGSRAAVQRHAREVHRSTGNVSDSSSTPAAIPQVNLTTGASLSCSRCGKLFQNKSNLKIHMLTHSGIKPFRCKEENCNAAFTTKQCLQFHYKKVHGFTEDMMPTIERSVEYTFEAYSGGQTIDDDLPPTTTATVPTAQSKKCIKSPPKIFQNNSMDNDNSSKEYSNEPTDQQHHTQQSCSPLPTIASRPTSPIEPNNIDSNSSKVCTTDCTDLVKHSFQNVPPMLSKGSKKWLGDITNHHQNNEICSVNFSDDQDQQPPGVADDGGSVSSIILDVDESQPENNSENNKFTMCLNVYNPRHDSSNASLLVEAALDSVSDIQMNTESNQCSDNLVVSNLYPLSQQDNYNDIPGVEPSRGGGDDVTDYTDGLQNDEFSSPNSPLQNHLIHDYVRHHDDTSRIRNEYLIDVDRSSNHTPPRYDFNNISNDSDGAQNLTIKDKDRNLEQQLDFSSYKTHYGSDLDTTDLSIRKYDSLRSKFDLPDERDAYNITIDVTDGRKSYDDIRISNEPYSDVLDTSELKNTVDEIRNKAYESIDSEALRALKYDLESKYEIEIRNKGYDYDSTLDTDMRTSKSYIDTADFRTTDRTFEPMILNSTELQGLDMSARSYHGFHTAASSVSRYHHMYGDTDRDSGVGGYGPPTDILRVVSLDLTSQSRHGTTLHGLPHHGLLTDHSRLSLDQSRLISSEHNLSVALLGTDSRLLSDHTTNRLLSNDQLSETRIVTSPDTHRMLSESTRLSTRGFSSYSMSPAAYHPSSLTARSHLGSPSHNPPSYHHYSGYY